MKKIFVYFLVLQITLLPTFRVWAFAPAVAVAWNLATSAPVRVLATEVALEVVSRGFAANDPLYASKGKLSRSKYVSWLKGKGKYVGYISSALLSAGFSVIGDQIVKQTSTKPDYENDPEPQKGVAWRYGSIIGETVSSAASKRCSGYQYCSDFEIQPYRFDESRDDHRTVVFKLESGAIWVTDDYGMVLCNTLTPTQQALIPTCSPSWEPQLPGSSPASDSEIDSDFLSWISTRPDGERRFPFSDDDGRIHPDLIPMIDVPLPPTMPDGSPLPERGHQKHIYSDWFVRGTYQSDDPNAPNYIPPSEIPDAKYLGEQVAGNNQSITNSNANGNPLPEPDKPTNPDTNPSPDPNAVYKVEVTNLEQPLTKEQLEASYNGAADSLSGSVEDMNDWTDDYFSQSEDALKNMLDNSLPDSWFTNIFAFAPTGSGQCLGWQANLQVFTPDRNYSNDVMFDAHCESYDTYIRPLVEYSLWMFTLIYVYRIGVKTLRAAP